MLKAENEKSLSAAVVETTAAVCVKNERDRDGSNNDCEHATMLSFYGGTLTTAIILVFSRSFRADSRF